MKVGTYQLSVGVDRQTNVYGKDDVMISYILWLLRVWPKSHCHNNLTIIELLQQGMEVVACGRLTTGQSSRAN